MSNGGHHFIADKLRTALNLTSYTSLDNVPKLMFKVYRGVKKNE